MNHLLQAVNNAQLEPHQRISALREYARTYLKPFDAACAAEINNHIHTIYSFSPYTPSMAALCAYNAGLGVAGSVDHDSIGAAHEMSQACELLKIGCVTGFEVRVSFLHTAFANKKINNPDSTGIVYMTVQGIPQKNIKKVEAFLRPLQKERHERNKKMVQKLNFLLPQSLKVDYKNDILPLSQSKNGGGVTERHILYALSLRLINEFGKGKKLIDFLINELKIEINAKIDLLLHNQDNPHYAYDVLGLLKSGFLERIFIQPNHKECIAAEKVTQFAHAINAIPAYAYLGDVGESPTGDKRAEKFEDDFLDELFDALKKMGFLAVTYMPPRNTQSQMERVQKLCGKYGFLEISGVDINSSRQTFNCAELRQESCKHLVDTTWSLVAHEKLADSCDFAGLFSPKNLLKNLSLQDKINIYAQIGKKITTCIY